MTKKQIYTGLASAGTFAALALPAIVLAQTSSAPLGVAETGLGYGVYTGLPTQDLRIVIANIIRTAMGLLGIIAVLIVLFGGFKWMTAGGSDEKVGEAKKIITSGIIGLIIIITAYAISSFVITSLISAAV